MRVVGTNEIDFMPLHALKPHPDVSLNVFHDVADVERAVRVRQRSGDEQLPGSHEPDRKGSGLKEPAGAGKARF